MYTILAPGKTSRSARDRLTLNVEAPESPPEATLPVMVFIHGGGYFMGNSATPISTTGRRWAREDARYVSVNYRLGALPEWWSLTFSIGCPTATHLHDNLYLRDLVMALTWVRGTSPSSAATPTT